MKIDAHQHFWKYDPVRDAWIDDRMQVLQRDFLPADLEPLLKEAGMAGSVAVQADQSETETLFLLELAETNPSVKAVVGWVDFRGENITERLAHFSEYKKLAGFRHIVQAEKDEHFLLRDNFCRGISALSAHDFTYDILVYPHQLNSVLQFVRRFPNQKFVIDHLTKPNIKDRQFSEWSSTMREIARQENVWCKVSGMVTEADWKHWEYEHFLPCLDLVTAAFGTKRLMYGSDWPVCLLAADYQQTFGLASRYYESFSTAEKEDIFGKVAQAFYRIPQ